MNRHAKASSAGSTLRRAGSPVFLGLLVAFVALAFASAASAVPLVELSKFGAEAGEAGGQIKGGTGVAINRSGAGGVEPGDTYASEYGNQRVQEFSKNGTFIRAWGKDVIKPGEPSDTGTGFEICEVASECKSGVAGAQAGAFSVPSGVAVDQDTGNVYVSDSNNMRTEVFSARGQFEGAFGWNVKATGGAQELQFCTTGTGCRAGAPAAGAGGFARLEGGALAVDPANGDLWVGDSGNHRINEFGFTLNGSEEVTGVEFVRALGWKINATAPAEELQECTGASGCQAGTVGTGGGQFGTVRGLAVDASGAIYAIDNNSSCVASTPCRVEKFNPDGSFKETFGPSSGGEAGCQMSWSGGGFENGNPQGTAFADAAFGIAVNPVDQHVFVTRRVGSAAFGQLKTLDICEFNSEGTLLQRSPRSPVNTTIEGALKLAIGSDERVYVQAPNELNSSWPVTIFGYVPAAPASLSAPTELTSTSVTLNGEVTVPKPGGAGFDVRYHFEYSPDNGLTWLRVPALADASVGTTTPGTYAVHQKVSGLLQNNTYRVRLVTSTSYVTTSEERSFTTLVGSPRVGEVRARDASQGTVTLEAKVNPAGSPTNYRFEWGPTEAYGNQAPAEFEPFAGSGHEAARVTAKLAGLSTGTTYHYRVVAHNAGGTTASPDQIAETLNSCGLPEGRCFELVSMREAGPIAIPGENNTSPAEMHFQAATNPGALAYVVEAGYPEATKGAEVLYRGTRGTSGWESTQISNPIVAPNEQAGVGSVSGNTQFLSNDLSCGFLESPQPLTDDPSTRLVIEDGGSNLYRINPDGSYAAVTKLTPENPDFEGVAGRNNYTVVGASQDCSKVLFSSAYRYPGIAGQGSNRFYEWDEGTLRNAGVVPGPGGEEVVVQATAGTFSNFLNAVSADGSRVFFSAKRQVSPNPKEIGNEAIFVREGGGASVRDVSLSQTATPDAGATYQWATPDGAHVFFTANAGLTEESSSEGTDLYEYNLETEELTDRSASQVEGGARVAGFVGAAEDGSRAYFASQAQLVPGRGNTQAENQSGDTYSVYGESAGEISFVGTIGKTDLSRVATEFGGNSWTSRVSPDGQYLLFQSTANVTGYESGASYEAYLYDAHGGSEGTTCISCRQDGQPSVAPSGAEPYIVLAQGQAANSLLHPAEFLIMHEGEPRVFFSSLDPLAPGAVVGQTNAYEWAHGQVFRLSSSIKGQLEHPSGGYGSAFVGASDDGSDVYLFTPETLNWEDGDERLSVYDARVGGGFPEPPAPPVPCEATSEGSNSCQGPAQGASASPGAASAAFNGPGNPPASKQKKSKKKPHKKHKHAKKKGKGKRARHANGNRRAGK